MTGKISQITEVTEYDGTTGEITKQSTSKTINWGTEPDYIKLYLEDVLYLSDMSTQYAAVVTSLLKRVHYAGIQEKGLCVSLSTYDRDCICEELGLKNRQSLANVLQKLVKGNILFKIGRGAYRFNPYLFGKGAWADIAKIRMEVTYDLKGRTFKSTIENKTQEV